MTRTSKSACFAVSALAVVALAGCRMRGSANGSFSRTFTVSGPVRLDLTNGSGDNQVSAGPAGEVQIHAELHIKSWSTESGKRRAKEIEQNPPISQEGNLIRVGGFGKHTGDVSINYTIVVPPDTEIRGVTGSGDMEVNGIKGPANFTAGSGNISASNIASDVQAIAGSGDLHFSNVQGQVQATAGSGNISLDGVRGESRLQTGSGDLKVAQPGDAVVANTGSGKVTITGASTDLRLRSSSGDVVVDGNPGTSNYWDFHTGSGNVTLHVPSASSFRFYAHTGSGSINAGIPIVMEGTAGKHELRARIGDGKARVEVETSSGNIAIR